MARQRLSTGWAVCTDAEGHMTIIDQHGEHPLEHPDPVQRLVAHCLAARSPLLREALEEACELADRLLPLAYQWKRDGKRVMGWRAAIVMTHPSGYEIARVMQQEEQQKRAA